MNKTFMGLVGKTIKRVTQMKLASGEDDKGWLLFEFTDGTNTVITADYGGYTGNSMDEYPTMIFVSKVNKKIDDSLIPIKI